MDRSALAGRVRGRRRLPYRGDVAAVGIDPGGAVYVVDGQGRVYRGLDRGEAWDGRG